MINRYGKRAGCLFFSFLLFFMPLLPASAAAEAQANQVQEFTFTIVSKLYPDSVGNASTRFIRSLAQALDMLKIQGNGLTLNGQVDMQTEILLNGLSAVQARFQGTENRLVMHSNLLGAEPAIVTLPNYIPFLLKFYAYFGAPVQYIGVFTDPYSYLHAILPALQQWTSLLGGNQSRTYSPAECVEIASQLSSSVGSDAMRFWLQGLLLHYGLDEILLDFFYALPEWMESAAGDEGLQVNVTSQGQTWTLGGVVVYEEKCQDGKTTWTFALPEWEGYQLTGSGTASAGDGGLQASMEWRLLEEGALYASFCAQGENLPDGKLSQGDSLLTLSFGGELFTSGDTIPLALHWQKTEGDKTMLKGQLDWLNADTKKPILTLGGEFAWEGTTEPFQSLKEAELTGTDVFCMNDETIRPFFSSIKKSLLRTALPFVLELPAGLIDGLFDWMEERGMMQTITENTSGEE